jgi:hypothetical protein
VLRLRQIADSESYVASDYEAPMPNFRLFVAGMRRSLHCMPSRVRGLFSVALLVACCPRASQAAWPSDPTANLPICSAASDQVFPTVVPDGASGAIITWMDGNPSHPGLYAQRVNFAGATQWTSNGVALSPSASYDYYGAPAIPDGAGGAIATWMAYSPSKDDIYAQRINGAGVTQWTTNGVAICTGIGDHSDPVIASDGAGGAIIAWRDHRSTKYDIYAQRVNAAGVIQWTADGVSVCTSAGDHDAPDIVPDGVGGAVIVWVDHRGADGDIYAQRLNGSGAPLWAVDGVAVCTAAGFQLDPSLMVDGAGGAFVTWEDQRNGNYDVFVQRLNSAGSALWAGQGVAACLAAGNQVWPRMATDAAGGVILAWRDQRTATQEIYAQRLSGAGAAQWAANGVGVVVGGTSTSRAFPRLVPDGGGGAIIAWQDNNGGTNILAQRLSSSGTTNWASGGAAVSTASGEQTFLSHGGEALNFNSMIPDGTGGAIVVWEDTRNGPQDIYAQRIQHDGTLGGTAATISFTDVGAGLQGVYNSSVAWGD